MKKNKAVHAIIRGRVQGVFFRMETRRMAEQHGVYGWVKNCANGSVEAVFEGAVESVDQVIDWCQTGPPMAEVRDIKLDTVEYTGQFRDFSLRYD